VEDQLRAVFAAVAPQLHVPAPHDADVGHVGDVVSQLGLDERRRTTHRRPWARPVGVAAAAALVVIVGIGVFRSPPATEVGVGGANPSGSVPAGTIPIGTIPPDMTPSGTIPTELASPPNAPGDRPIPLLGPDDALVRAIDNLALSSTSVVSLVVSYPVVADPDTRFDAHIDVLLDADLDRDLATFGPVSRAAIPHTDDELLAACGRVSAALDAADQQATISIRPGQGLLAIVERSAPVGSPCTVNSSGGQLDPSGQLLVDLRTAVDVGNHAWRPLLSNVYIAIGNANDRTIPLVNAAVNSDDAAVVLDVCRAIRRFADDQPNLRDAWVAASGLLEGTAPSEGVAAFASGASGEDCRSHNGDDAPPVITTDALGCHAVVLPPNFPFSDPRSDRQTVTAIDSSGCGFSLSAPLSRSAPPTTLAN